MADVLDSILEARKKAVKDAKERVTLAELEQAAKQSAGRSFLGALNQPGRITVIAEMKTKSPSAGPIRTPYDPAAIAADYEKGGADALSVLTEPNHFGGSLADIRKARNASRLPILRKDFIFDAFQIAEAGAFGADAVLLIADMLAVGQLHELVAYAYSVGLEPIVEVFTEADVPGAINSGARVIGVNTRDLRTLDMREENVMILSRLIPRDRLIVAESGLKTAEDIEKLKSLRIQSVLIGEALLKEPDVAAAVRRLVDAGRRKTI